LFAVGYGSLASDVLGRNIALQWVLGFVSGLAVVGVSVLRHDLIKLIESIDDPQRRSAAAQWTRPIGWALPPVAIAGVLTVVGAMARAGVFPLAFVAVDALLVFLIIIPMGTWLWTYAVTLSRLDVIALDLLDETPFPTDPALGTRPVGTLAFRGFAVFAAGILPLLIILALSPLNVAAGLAIFFGGLAVFVFSLWRLHQRLLASKARHVAAADALYDSAVAELRAKPSPDSLSRAAPTVGAAIEIQARARALAEWPVDEAIPARLLVIVTGVVTTVVAALVLNTLGIR
jgi:hypothetical protein